MFELMKKRIKNEKGLTLVEVLAVVVILAIVAMIAIPAIGNIIENNRIKAIKADAVNIISAANIYYTDGGTEFNADEAAKYVDSFGSIDPASTVNTFGVTRDGKITAYGENGNVKITFTGATIEEINADSTDPHSNVDIDTD